MLDEARDDIVILEQCQTVCPGYSSLAAGSRIQFYTEVGISETDDINIFYVIRIE